MLTQPMGNMMNLTSGPIGKPNCVELHVPANVGGILGSVLGANPMQMAFGGGINDVKKNTNRTYYFSCETVEMANSWVAALQNNITVRTFHCHFIPFLCLGRFW